MRADSFRQGRCLGFGLRVEEKCFVLEEVLIFSSTETNNDDFRKFFGTCTVLSGQNQKRANR